MKISTQIVGNALHNIVEEVNAVQQGNVVELDNGLSFDLDALMSPEDRRAKYNRIKSAVREAWNATTLMDEFDMESGFKSHYNENRNTLKSMCNQMGISTYVSRPVPVRPAPKPTATPSAKPTPVRPTKPVPCQEPKEMEPIIAVVIIHVIWGLFGLSDGIGGFFGAMFVGIVGWIIPINFVAYMIIEWIYKQINK